MNQRITNQEFINDLAAIRAKDSRWITGPKAYKTIRQWCYYLFWDALEQGIITRPKKCERCGHGQHRGLDGHHASYYEPIKVEWLCRKCHRKHHLATA